jgi:hypothetical protein
MWYSQWTKKQMLTFTILNWDQSVQNELSYIIIKVVLYANHRANSSQKTVGCFQRNPLNLKDNKGTYF